MVSHLEFDWLKIETLLAHDQYTVLEKIIEKKELFSLKKGFGNITKNPTYLLEFDNKQDLNLHLIWKKKCNFAPNYKNMPSISIRGKKMPESPIRKLAPFADLAK